MACWNILGKKKNGNWALSWALRDRQNFNRAMSDNGNPDGDKGMKSMNYSTERHALNMAGVSPNTVELHVCKKGLSSRVRFQNKSHERKAS